uniref:Uncharacterized protein n=1 Tax=Anguilla anguilla TaxID=7936 RepID=A0A0E9X994_ANGAN
MFRCVSSKCIFKCFFTTQHNIYHASIYTKVRGDKEREREEEKKRRNTVGGGR